MFTGLGHPQGYAATRESHTIYKHTRLTRSWRVAHKGGTALISQMKLKIYLVTKYPPEGNVVMQYFA